MLAFISIVLSSGKPLVIELNKTKISDGTLNQDEEFQLLLKYSKLVNISLDYFQSLYYQQSSLQQQQQQAFKSEYRGYFKLFHMESCMVYGHEVLESGVKYIIGINEQENTDEKGDTYSGLDISIMFSDIQKIYLESRLNPLLDGSDDPSTQIENKDFKNSLRNHICQRFFPSSQTDK